MILRKTRNDFDTHEGWLAYYNDLSLYPSPEEPLIIEDDDFARELGLIEALTEHKPGKHDQKSHGKRGGMSREEFDNASMADIKPHLEKAWGSAAGKDLEGLPTSVGIGGGERMEVHSYAEAQRVAESYMKEAGLDYDPPTEYAKVKKAHGEAYAKAYEDMKHDPDNPEVQEAYAAMAKETIAQYDHIIKNTNMTFEFMPDGPVGSDPYAQSPRKAVADTILNDHMYIFPTSAGYGQAGSAALNVKEFPLLADSGRKFAGKPATVNDIFRAVHDYMGHVKEGNGFRAFGEENAYQSHSAMYSPKARRAMASETRGQNSWVNYGPHAEFNRKASGGDTVYAPQKTGLLPEWAMQVPSRIPGLREHKPGKHDQKKHGKKGAGAARGDIEGHDLDQGAFGSKMGEARAVSDSIERDVLAASESAQRQIEKYESLDMDPSRFTSGLLKDALVRNIAKEAGLEYEEVNTMVAQWAESSNDTDMRSLALQRDAAAEFGIELSQFQKDKISSLEARKAQSDAMKAYAEGPMEPTREEIGEKMAEALRFGAPNRGSLTVISTLNKIEAPDAENVKGVLAEFGIRGVKNELAQNIAAAVKSGSAMSLLPAKAGNRKEDFLKRVEANERTTTPLFSSEKQRKFLRGMYDVTQRELSKRGVSEVHLIRGTRADVPTTGRNVRADLSSMSSWTTSLSTAEGFGSTIVSARIPANRIISMYGTGFGSRGEFEWVVLGGPARVNYDR